MPLDKASEPEQIPAAGHVLAVDKLYHLCRIVSCLPLRPVLSEPGLVGPDCQTCLLETFDTHQLYDIYWR